MTNHECQTCTKNPHLAAASCYIELIVKESDNNVKLIVLDRLEEIRNKHDRVLDDLVMDILQVLSRYLFYTVSFRFKLEKLMRFISPALILRCVARLSVSLWRWFPLEMFKRLFSSSKRSYPRPKMMLMKRYSCMNLLTWETPIHHSYIEYRVSSAFDSIHSHLRHQILRSCRQCCSCTDGVLGRFQQPSSCRCRCVCP